MLTLTRTTHTDQGTFGRLVGPGVSFFTLECPWRDNRSMVSCVPEGRYEVVWAPSPRFKRHTYRLVGVRDRAGVLIHSANFAGDPDEGWISQLNGCIALGLREGAVMNRDNKLQHAVISSMPAVRAFEAHMGRKPFTLEIKS